MSAPRALALLCGLLALPVCADAGEREVWTQVRSPHFLVVTDSGESQGRRVAAQFEQIRSLFGLIYPQARLDDGKPFVIVGAKDEKVFKTFLPGFWEQKGHLHPAGIYYSTTDKNYVGLQLDLGGSQSYSPVYHEYFHMVENLNFEGLPLWLQEGMADFFANTEFRGKRANVGKPNKDYLVMFQRRTLLPLDELFAIDRNSPYYKEENKASIFYGESWALVHYLMMSDRAARRDKLARFLQLLGEGAPNKQAAAQAFGDLKRLEKELYRYISLLQFYSQGYDAPAGIDEKQFPARRLSEAEGVALRGDFLVHSRRFGEGRAALQEALRLDPGLPLAQEGMGLLCYLEKNPAEAAKWFSRAVQQNSQNFIAYYFDGVMTSEQGSDPEALGHAEASLHRAIQLNVNYPPAYEALAMLYLRSGEHLDQALTLAAKAVQLRPSDMAYRLSYGAILLRLGQTDDAVALGERMVRAAETPQQRTSAEEFLSAAGAFRESSRKAPGSAESGAPGAGSAAGKAEGRAGGEEAATSGRPQLHRRDGSTVEAGAAAVAKGIISETACTGFRIDLTLEGEGTTLRLHANDFSEVKFLSNGWRPPEPFEPCRDLLKRHARVEYKEAQGKPYVGEIISIRVLESQ